MLHLFLSINFIWKSSKVPPPLFLILGVISILKGLGEVYQTFFVTIRSKLNKNDNNHTSRAQEIRRTNEPWQISRDWTKNIHNFISEQNFDLFRNLKTIKQVIWTGHAYVLDLIRIVNVQLYITVSGIIMPSLNSIGKL